MNQAVLFIVFNRIEPAQRVFEQIRRAKPVRLYVASDGPRSSVRGEGEKIEKLRSLLLEKTDWDCEVKTLFREENAGCRVAVSEAISWFFRHEEEGIILEDDCLPSDSFFQFCNTLLSHYREDERVMMISGYNKFQSYRREKDYFFSKTGSIWGWASWRRAWAFYETDLEMIRELIEGESANLRFELGEELFERRMEHLRQLDEGLDTWDYQWALCRSLQSGLTCVPSRSLIQNIGFGEDASHTTTGNDYVVREELKAPIRFNNTMIADHLYDGLIPHKPEFHSEAEIKTLLKLLRRSIKAIWYRFIK